MEYLSVVKTAEKWGISQRSVRNYCSEGRIPGAFLTGKTWNIPADAEKPSRAKRRDAAPDTLLDELKKEKAAKLPGGIYHKIQIELTYNSNHMEGSRLTHDQTRYIYETNTIGVTEAQYGRRTRHEGHERIRRGAGRPSAGADQGAAGG